MRLRLPLSAIPLLLAAGVGCSTNQSNAARDAASGGTADSGAFDDGESNGPDGGPWCPGPLGDAGFTSLANFPAASLCAGGYVDNVSESTHPCQGFTVVYIGVGVDGGGWWLFDANGDLVAKGSSGSGIIGPDCEGAVPGLKFPYQCFLNGGWPQTKSLCPDAGTSDAAPSDGATDAAHE